MKFRGATETQESGQLRYNKRRVRSLLKIHFASVGANDSDEVHVQSSNYVLNILYFFVKKGYPFGAKSLGKDPMGAMFQGLQIRYDNAGYTRNGQVGPDGSATGNPLRGNIVV
jgi:hypothetical protein